MDITHWDTDMTIIELARLTENEARVYLEKIRWPNGPVCPHCQSQECTRLEGEKHRPGTIQCNACRGQFTLTVGSVMESSHVSLVKWVMAFHLLCSSKKSFSAKQLQRELGLGSYRTAWFMMHRVRHAMGLGEEQEPALKGEVEVDETYVGGKPRYKGHSKRGRGTSKKPVVALVSREGDVRCRPVENVTAATLHSEIHSTVAKESTILTDELSSYNGIGKHFDGGHQTVNHGRKEYARKSGGKTITTNSVESFFALIKRGHYGVYHQLSKIHLHRYCNEFAFRWRFRKVTDHVRTEAALAGSAGKRLMFWPAPPNLIQVV